MSVVNVNKEIQEQQMNIVSGSDFYTSQGLIANSLEAESLLRGSVGAIGDKPGEGHKGGAARAEEVPAAAQGPHGELPEGRLHNEETAQEKGHTREHRKGAKGGSYQLLISRSPKS